jgi:arylsulfatase A-like enzyme/Flp pilus assembly protein TadD
MRILPTHRQLLDTLTLRIFAVFLVSICIVTFLSSCQGTDNPPVRERLQNLNVILITIDTLRADHVGAYGKRAATPNLDLVAREGVVFNRCIAQVPLTLPSHTTILSGTYPLHHGVRGNGGYVVPADLELVSEALQAKGMATSAFVGAYVLHSKWGLDQGFDHYEGDFGRHEQKGPLSVNSKRAAEVLGSAKEWIRAHKEDHFFSWIHLFDPHTPYDPPPPFDRYPEEPYRGEVEYTDHELGKLIAFLEEEGLYDRCLIIVTADHGEGLGDHGEQEHGFFVYEPSVWVPLFIRAPFAMPVQQVESLVESVDIAPTVLDALAVAIPESYQGESLWGHVLGENPVHSAEAYSETYYPRLHYGWSELKAFYQGDLKYILAPEPELYDVSVDPEERSNIAADPLFSEQRMSFDRKLQEFVVSRSAGAVDATSTSLSREDLAALQALGYATTSVDTSQADDLPDPKDKIDIYNRVVIAGGLRSTGRIDEAIAAAKEVLREEPRLVDGHVLLGYAYKDTGRFREAAESFKTVIELKPDAIFAMIDLVTILINLREYDEAVQQARTFIGLFPDDPVLHEQLGAAYWHKRSYDQALDHLLKSIDIEPAAGALGKAGEIYAIKGDHSTAESYIRRALALDPTSEGQYYVLATIEDERGNSDKAVELYEKELENNPKEFRAAFNIAAILVESGRRDLAIPYYRKTIAANPRFNLPYFRIAEHFRQNNTNLEEAIELCKRGIDVAPRDESALLGYQTLLRLLAKTGDRESFELYSARANELARDLGKAPRP